MNKIHRISNHTTVSTRIIKSLKKKLDAYCIEHDTNKTAVLRKLLTEFLRDHE